MSEPRILSCKLLVVDDDTGKSREPTSEEVAAFKRGEMPALEEVEEALPDGAVRKFWRITIYQNGVQMWLSHEGKAMLREGINPLTGT